MKKVLLFLLLFLRLMTFGNMNSHTSRLIEKREVIGEGIQSIKYETNDFKITGLGNYDRLIYDFKSYGNQFFKQGQLVESAIEITQMWIEPLDATVDRNNKFIVGFHGECRLKVAATVRINNNSKLSGRYTSHPIILSLKGRHGHNSEYDEVTIEVILELEVTKALKVSTTTMDLGTGVQGQRLSSSNGTHGYLNIEGEANRNVVISYPSQVEIFNKVRTGSIKIEISTPGLYPLGNGDYGTVLSEKGEKNVIFVGESRETKEVQPGEYTGNFQVKVRYN
ncbi:MAG: hypothetical protein ACRCUD_05460 [Cetobacterium sp.]